MRGDEYEMKGGKGGSLGCVGKGEMSSFFMFDISKNT